MSNFRENLRDHPLLGVLIILILYNVFLIIPLVLQSLFFVITGIDYYLVIFWIQFGLMFAFLALFLIYLTPKSLHLPNGEKDISTYLKDIKFTQIEPIQHNISLGLISGGIYLFFQYLGLLITGDLHMDFAILFTSPSPNNLGALLWIHALRPAIWEEVAFRGVIMTLLLRKYSPNIAILLDGVAFGLMHIINALLGANLLISIVQTIYAMIMGFFFAYLYLKTKSLLPCILAHYIIDSIGMILYVDNTNMVFMWVNMVGIMVTIPTVINILLVKKYTDYLL